MRAPAIAVAVLVAATTSAAPSIVSAKGRAKKKDKGPTQITPTKKRKRERPPKDADLSEGGTRRGGIEITLGAVTAGVVAILIGRGIWELFEAKRLERECPDDFDQLACNLPNPPRHPRIAAGLSFGVAIPIGVASGLLFARGVRIHRDFKAYRRANPELSLRPLPLVQGGGLALGGRF